MRPRNQFVGPHLSQQRTRDAGAGGLFLLWLSFRTTLRVPPFDLERYAMVGLNCYHRHVSERSVTRTFMLLAWPVTYNGCGWASRGPQAHFLNSFPAVQRLQAQPPPWPLPCPLPPSHLSPPYRLGFYRLARHVGSACASTAASLPSSHHRVFARPSR